MSAATASPSADAAPRPALADVLACLTTQGSVGWWRASLSARRVRIRSGRVEAFTESRGRWFCLRAWRFGRPAGALEALEAAGLAPEDDGSRRWCHYACYGCGLVDAPPAPDRCPRCSSRERNVRVAGEAPAVASLAAVASLGVGAWLRAEELARVIDPGAAAVWRAVEEAHLASMRAGSWLKSDQARAVRSVVERGGSEAVGRACVEIVAMGLWVVSHDRGRTIGLAAVLP